MKESKHHSTNVIIKKILGQVTRTFKATQHTVEKAESPFRRGQIDGLKTLKLWWLENQEDIIKSAEEEEVKKQKYIPDLVKTIMDVTDRLKPELSFYEDEYLLLRLSYEEDPAAIVDKARAETIRALGAFNLKGEEFQAGEDIYVVTRFEDVQKQESRETTRLVYLKLVEKRK